MDTATGIVVLAQETRFRLVDPMGRAQTFLLAHDAPIEPEDLQDLQRRQAHVTVWFTQPHDLVAKVAHELQITDPHPARMAERRTGETP